MPAPTPRHGTPSPQLPPHPSYPGERAPQHQSIFAQWERLTRVLAQTFPTQDVQVRRTIRRFTTVLR